MDKIKVGVIGVGSMGKNHVRSYAALKNLCEFKGVYDLDQNLAEEIADSYGVIAYSSLTELMKEVDAVNIATPTTTHYKIAKKAIKNDLHILLEKPITNTIEEAEDLLEAARKKGLTVQVGHIERFNPAIQALPDLLQGEEIIAIDVKRMGPYDPRIDDTDVVQDLMIHDLDVVSSISPTSVIGISAFGSIIKSKEHIDYAVANLLMNNGIIATVTASRVTNKKVRKLTIITHNSYIELDYMQKKIVITNKSAFKDGGYSRENELEEVFNESEEPLKMQLSHFINSIENDTRPLINGSDGLEALKLTKIIQEQIYKNQEANKSYKKGEVK
ncbi:MAG: Gfo/Idh/MocA family oxidoreductase [Candidatus Woesearchaeota archaeon]